MPVESVELRVELPDLSGWGLWIMVQFANTMSGLRAVIRRVSGRGIIVIASQRITGSFFCSSACLTLRYPGYSPLKTHEAK